MQKKKGFWSFLDDVDIESIVRVIMACLIAFGGYTKYTNSRLNDFIIQVETQNVSQQKTINSLESKINREDKEIKEMRKDCTRESSFYQL